MSKNEHDIIIIKDDQIRFFYIILNNIIRLFKFKKMYTLKIPWQNIYKNCFGVICHTPNIYFIKNKNLVYTYDNTRNLLTILDDYDGHKLTMISSFDFKGILEFINRYKYCAKENFYSVSCSINEKGNILIKHQENFIKYFIKYIFDIDKNKAINIEFVVFEDKKLFCDILKDLIKIEEQL